MLTKYLLCIQNLKLVLAAPLTHIFYTKILTEYPHIINEETEGWRD